MTWHPQPIRTRHKRPETPRFKRICTMARSPGRVMDRPPDLRKYPVAGRGAPRSSQRAHSIGSRVNRTLTPAVREEVQHADRHQWRWGRYLTADPPIDRGPWVLIPPRGPFTLPRHYVSERLWHRLMRVTLLEQVGVSPARARPSGPIRRPLQTLGRSSRRSRRPPIVRGRRLGLDPLGSFRCWR